jgi:hypothetical protein
MPQDIDLSILLPGTLSSVTQQKNEYFRLTWKENGKTVTRYIRNDEVKHVRLGVKAYQNAKKTIDSVAHKNLKTLIRHRGKK